MISGGVNCSHPVTSMGPVEGAEGLTECLSCHAIFENAHRNEDGTFGGDMLLGSLGKVLDDIAHRHYHEVEDVGVVKRANVSPDGSLDISTATGSGFIISKENIAEGTKIRRGDRVRVHLTQGSTVKGVYYGTKNGDDFDAWRCVFHLTNEQMRARQAAGLIGYQHDKAKQYLAARVKLDADFAALPEVFRRRIERRRVNNPTFRVEYEGYELFVCVEAVKLADHLRPTFDRIMSDDPLTFIHDHEALKGDSDVQKIEDEDDPVVRRYVAWLLAHMFDKLPYEDQVQVMSDQHSGNTHGAAVTLAWRYLAGLDDEVVGMPGAMSPLVGSVAYGDVSEEEAAVEV